MMTEADFQTVAQVLTEQGGPLDVALEGLKTRWPQWRFHLCSEDDIPARLRPLAEGPGFALYAIGSGEHCIALTNDPEKAIGFVVAVVE